MAEKTKYKACYVDAVKTDGTWEVNDLHTFFMFETSSNNVKRSFMRNLHKHGMNFPRHFQFVEDDGEYKVVKREDLKPILLITIEPPIEARKIEGRQANLNTIKKLETIMNEFDTCFQSLNVVSSWRPMSPKMSDIILEKFKEHTQHYLTDVYIQLYCMNERLKELVAGKRKHVFEIIGFRENGVDHSEFVISNGAANKEYKEILLYEAHVVKGELAEAISTNASEFLANNFINTYFDKETLQLKEQYR